MKKMPPLPRQLNSNDAGELREVVRQIIDYLHALPRFEIKKMAASTSDYHTVKTDLKRPVIMLVGQAYKTEEPDTTVSVEGLPDWRRVDDGLKHRIDTSEENYMFHYLIIGEGEQ